MAETVETQIDELEREVAQFVESLDGVDPTGLSKRLGSWTPRDIIAHLIGWNRYSVRGCRDIAAGRLPFYDVDPGDNYQKINAILVREYPSRDKTELLRELRRSVEELVSCLRELPPGDWERDFGVRHRGEVVTIRSSVDELVEDYVHHRGQISDWMSSSGN